MVQFSSQQQERLNQVNNDKQTAVNQTNSTYDVMQQNEENRKAQIDNMAEQYETTQNNVADMQLANEQAKIEQQKEDAKKQNFNERVKALNSYTEYTNPYGYQSEIIGNSGLLNSGISDVAKQSSYVTYQNRVATANTALQEAMTKYDQEMNDAILNNDVTKANNALTKLQTKMNNIDTFYTNSNNIAQNRLSTLQNLDTNYASIYNTVYNQVMAEKEFDENVRQFNASLSASKSSSGGGSSKTGYVTNEDTTVTEQNNEPTYSAVKSPVLSKAKASSQFAILAGNKALTASQLATIISQVDKKYGLTDDDINKIYKVYGISTK